MFYTHSINTAEKYTYRNLRHLHCRLDARTAKRKLLGQQAAGQTVHSQAAVRFGHMHIHQAPLPSALHQLPGIRTAAVQFGGDRHHFGACKLSGRQLNVHLIVGQAEVGTAYARLFIGSNRCTGYGGERAPD